MLSERTGKGLVGLGWVTEWGGRVGLVLMTCISHGVLGWVISRAFFLWRAFGYAVGSRHLGSGWYGRDGSMHGVWMDRGWGGREALFCM